VIRLLESLFPAILWRVQTKRDVVALTFDDGPHSQHTPQVLEILKTYDATATFFLIGANALRHPDIIARIRAEGHSVGNHLFLDEYIMLKREDALEENLLKTEATLTLDGDQKFIRPPRLIFGPAFARVARRHGYKIVLGSAYTSDPYRPPAWYIAWAMKRMLKPGAILVLHDGGGNRGNTVHALPAILRSARERGLRLETLDDAVGGR